MFEAGIRRVEEEQAVREKKLRAKLGESAAIVSFGV